MTATHRTVFSLATLAMLSMSATAQAEVFVSAGSPGRCLTNQNGRPVATGCVLNAPGQNISMPYLAGENVFYGQLRIGGQCLDVSGSSLMFATCKPGDAQIWRFDGNTGMIRNGQGNCVQSAGGSVTTVPCSAGGVGLTWWTKSPRTAEILAVPGMRSTAEGTRLKVVNRDLVNSATGAIVAAGAGNIVAGGAGNIVAGGAGNIVAGGAGNIVVEPTKK